MELNDFMVHKDYLMAYVKYIYFINSHRRTLATYNVMRF